jgi:hypothetical protein
VVFKPAIDYFLGVAEKVVGAIASERVDGINQCRIGILNEVEQVFPGPLIQFGLGYGQRQAQATCGDSSAGLIIARTRLGEPRVVAS